MATIRTGLFREIVSMSFDTLRTSKMRSALTVLGVVIGITSIVGMTSLMRGFDERCATPSARSGRNTVFVQKFSALSFSAGKSFLEVAKRPNITREDARAVARESPSIAVVDVWLGGQDRTRVYYGHEKTTQIGILGATENFSAVNFIKLELGRLFTPSEVEHRRQVVVLGQNPYKSLFPNIDPLGKKVRIGANEFTVIGVFGKRPSPGGFGGADDFVVVPFTAQEKFYGKVVKGGYTGGGNVSRAAVRSAMIAIVPRDDATRAQAMAEAEAVMRIATTEA
jgi:putative ABC transport system permease protein